MDFLNFLIPKEKIVGIEIGEQKLRMLRLEKDSFGNVSIRGKSEIDLPEGTIVFGRVADKKKLSESLAKLKKEFIPQGELSRFAVVTISQNGVYSDVLELPKNLNNEQIIESISLNAAASLPMPLAECYLDWQVIGKGENKNKILVSVVSKEIADAYIGALEENDFSLIALEPAALSIARVADISEDPVIFFYLTDEGLTSIIYSQKNSYFSQFELWKEAAGGKEIKSITDLNKVLKVKINSLISYFESQYAPVKLKKIFLMSEGFDADKIIKSIDFSALPVEKAKSNIASLKNYDLIAVAGAAKRAFVPRSEDTIISLLPVGTETLYENEKMSSFANSIAIILIALSSFYAVVFIAAAFFISFVDSDIGRQMETRSGASANSEYAKLEAETKEFNNYTGSISAIYPKINADYGAVLESIAGSAGAGIILSNVSIGDVFGPVSISGTALSRESLNAYKIKMENYRDFSSVKFSVQNIAQKANIPFSISLQFKKK